MNLRLFSPVEPCPLGRVTFGSGTGFQFFRFPALYPIQAMLRA